jgi:hypothetical protein
MIEQYKVPFNGQIVARALNAGHAPNQVAFPDVEEFVRIVRLIDSFGIAVEDIALEPFIETDRYVILFQRYPKVDRKIRMRRPIGSRWTVRYLGRARLIPKPVTV